ncbi:hypothetical protein Q2100_28405, partial [Mycolicibacterium sp. KC 300]|nr:hypothetical protein [Mycolicibacterium arseniciresistens]
MRSLLGLSVGVTNLVAVPLTGPADRPAVRRSVLTLFGHRPPEVGLPGENAALDERGLVLSAFVERVGDPVPIVAPDGSTHRGEDLTVTALTALTRSAGRADVTGLAVPAYWPATAVDAVQARMPHAIVVSDAVAALTALQSRPGLPA